MRDDSQGKSVGPSLIFHVPSQVRGDHRVYFAAGKLKAGVALTTSASCPHPCLFFGAEALFYLISRFYVDL